MKEVVVKEVVVKELVVKPVVMKAAELLTLIDDAVVVRAISDAEMKTSGEIRVFVSSRAAADPLAEAARQFARLKMQATRERNAVLIFLAPMSRTFALYGDVGIHAKLGDAPWAAIGAKLSEAFKNGRWTAGLGEAIGEVGNLLAIHFPAKAGDNPDELPNAIERD